MGTHGEAGTIYLYWMPEEAFEKAREGFARDGLKLVGAKLTPCQAMRASGNEVIYVSPALWSRICVRQGSWYRASHRLGQYALMSRERLPSAYEGYLDAEIEDTDFMPDGLPTEEALQGLVEADSYRSGKPEEWEEKGLKDAFMFKVLFTLTRFWGLGDNLRKHWLSHRAVHANFLERKFTAEIDGEAVPYTVAENAGVCSSCVETFNLIGRNDRKLVRACPGAVTFGRARRDVYLDVKPSRTGETTPIEPAD